MLPVAKGGMALKGLERPPWDEPPPLKRARGGWSLLGSLWSLLLIDRESLEEFERRVHRLEESLSIGLSGLVTEWRLDVGGRSGGGCGRARTRQALEQASTEWVCDGCASVPAGL